MIAIGLLFVRMLCDCFKSRRRLEAEILVLRHQLNVLQQRMPRRVHLRWADRAVFIWLYRRYPRILDALSIVRPETVVRWHRKGFTGYWRWKSRSPGGRPRIAREVRDLIRRMSFENSLWGATKIHGELLKLGIAVAQSTVSVYMVPRQDRPLQTWKTFLRNHMEGIASIDLFVVPTIAFEQLFAFLVLGHKRRQLLWFAVIRNPTAEWLARQITEAFPWDFRKPQELISAPFLECYLKRAGDWGGNHATDHLLRAVDRHLAMLNGQRNLRSELWRPWISADCRCMLRIRLLKRGSGRRIC
jgi:hypothetical protein